MQELKHKYDCKVLFVCPSQVLGRCPCLSCCSWYPRRVGLHPGAARNTWNQLWLTSVLELVDALASLFLSMFLPLFLPTLK